MAISVDEKEIFYTIADSASTKMIIMTSRFSKTGWSIPTVAECSDSGDDIHPAFSPDGNRLYFSSIRPIDENDKLDDLNIWYVEKEGNNWSKPIYAGRNINSTGHETSPTFSQDGTIYFDAKVDKKNGNWDIYKSTFINNSFQKREKVEIVSTKEYKELGPFIAPDDSYLLFYSNHPDSYGEADIYISYKNEMNQFMQPINLGKKTNSNTMIGHHS